MTRVRHVDRCVDACLAGARTIAGRTMTVAEVMSELVRDRVFFEESGGGVTFSGGEPFTQPAFLSRACLMLAGTKASPLRSRPAG